VNTSLICHLIQQLNLVCDGIFFDLWCVCHCFNLDVRWSPRVLLFYSQHMWVGRVHDFHPIVASTVGGLVLDVGKGSWKISFAHKNEVEFNIEDGEKDCRRWVSSRSTFPLIMEVMVFCHMDNKIMGLPKSSETSCRFSVIQLMPWIFEIIL